MSVIENLPLETLVVWIHFIPNLQCFLLILLSNVGYKYNATT